MGKRPKHRHGIKRGEISAWPEGVGTPDEVAQLRGLSINQVLGLTSEPSSGAPDAANGAEPTPAAAPLREPDADEGPSTRAPADAGAGTGDEPEAAT